MKEDKKLIFLIESDRDILEVYSTALKQQNFDLDIFTRGREALSKIQNIGEKDKKPNLIMLDLKLIDMDGIEILKVIKENELTKNIPIFVFSEYIITELPKLNLTDRDKFIMYGTINLWPLMDMVKDQLK